MNIKQNFCLSNFYNSDYIFSWSWDDQRRVDYTNFAQITNYVNYQTRNCAVLLTNELQAGKWNQTECNTTHAVICEKGKGTQICSIIAVQL